ncbi:MAG: AMP-binding protein, partial [Actinomycetota bacterium]
MWPGRHARERPDHPAYVMAGTGEVVTYRQLDERSNRVAQLVHVAGLRFGDHIAVLMENRSEYFEPCWAAQRSGLTYTCINSHLTADEVAYIVDDCDARVLFTSDTLAEVATAIVERTPKVERRLVVGPTAVPGHEPYEE